MKRAGWPTDDTPRKRGTRRLRLWFLVNGSTILTARTTQEGADDALFAYPDARIRRAVATVRWIEP